MAWTEAKTKPPLKFDKDEEKTVDKKESINEERNLRMELTGLKNVDEDKPITKKPIVTVFNSSKDNK